MKNVFKIILVSIFISLSLTSCYKSEDVPGETIVDPSEFTQKLLIEDYTGTWCVNCPAAGHAIHNAVNGNDRFIAVGIHYRSTGEVMQNEFSETLVTNFNPHGIFPRVALNREEAVWTDDYLVSNLVSKLNKYAPVGLAINSNLVGNVIDVTVKVGFVEEMLTAPNYKLVVYLVEDEFVYPQHNASLPNLPLIIEDYEHNDILRYSFTNTLGDNIPNAIAGDHRFTQNFTSVNLPSTIDDITKIRIVAFVVDENNNCLNVQMATVGMDKDFD